MMQYYSAEYNYVGFSRNKCATFLTRQPRGCRYREVSTGSAKTLLVLRLLLVAALVPTRNSVARTLLML